MVSHFRWDSVSLAHSSTMRTVTRCERLQLFLVMITLAGELPADPLHISLVRMTLGDLPVGAREGRATGLQQTQI